MSEQVRLQKFIANSGYCSRRKAEELILDNKVRVNDETASLGTKIDPEKDMVYVNGQKISLEEKTVYIMLNKPPGFVSSCSHKGKKTIIDLIDVKERIYPVGRLDMYSRGLILLTNDGELHNRLSHPSYDHEKEYLVKTNIPLTDEEIKLLSNGVVIDKRKTRKVSKKRKKNEYLSFTLKEGRNRQIRKMVETLNKKVVDLIRIRMSEIYLGNLKEGKWRYLSSDETKKLTKK
ncbi:MAG: pseudouridine synthase [Desulforegulaceae bacterium]|nr:pseudouridine synthase [Desulforegulaceae bacterium]